MMNKLTSWFTQSIDAPTTAEDQPDELELATAPLMMEMARAGTGSQIVMNNLRFTIHWSQR